MNHNGNNIESRLWAAADELRANSKLKSSEYSVPVLGLVFLRYADHKFQVAAKELEGKGGGRRKIGPADYQARGVLYLPETARFSALIQLPERANIGAAINDAMRSIEAENPDLKDVLPKTYNRFENALLKELLKTMNSIPMDIEGDAFGKIYEYFLGHFSMSEGQKGGEFFTPTAMVKLLVAIIQPFHGRICDLANGSGGMFVQSARFTDSPLGQIPEGWEVVKFGNLIEIRKGKNITKNTIKQGSVPVVAGGMSPAYYHSASNTRQPVITISASGANAGFVCLYHENVWASDCSVIDMNTTPYVYFFYLQLKHRQTEVTRLQRGAAQPHVNPKDLMNLDAIEIPSDFLVRFNQEVTPVIQMIRNLTLKNTNLRRTRDLLLPRLISGEVDVSELDITVPEEAIA